MEGTPIIVDINNHYSKATWYNIDHINNCYSMALHLYMPHHKLLPSISSLYNRVKYCIHRNYFPLHIKNLYSKVNTYNIHNGILCIHYNKDMDRNICHYSHDDDKFDKDNNVHYNSNNNSSLNCHNSKGKYKCFQDRMLRVVIWSIFFFFDKEGYNFENCFSLWLQINHYY